MTGATGSCRIAALGECMIELRDDPGSGLSRGFAGDTLNTATYLRRLLPADFTVRYVTALGDDHLSGEMLDAWQADGIDTALVQRRPGELPGLYWIRTDASGEREFFYWRHASAARHVLADGHAARIRESLREGDVLYLSGVSFAILDAASRELLLELLADCRRRGTRIAFDTNFRARLWPGVADARSLIERVLTEVDLFITSHADEAALFGDPDIAASADRMHRSGVPEWVVRGAPGEAITNGGESVPAACVDPTQVVDTTGAGDSFDAAYLAARLAGYEISQALRAAHALAGIVVCRRGAIIAREATPSLSGLLGDGPGEAGAAALL